MTSLGSSGLPKCSSMALTEFARSRRESTRVPSRSKISSLTFSRGMARFLRIMPFQYIPPDFPSDAIPHHPALFSLVDNRLPASLIHVYGLRVLEHRSRRIPGLHHGQMAACRN